MTERDRGMAIAMLAEGFNVKELTSARIKILERALQKVPVSLLEPMVQRAIATRKPRWGDVPTVAELLEDAEACRIERLHTLKFEPCESCSTQGWTEREIDGVKRMVRCTCWHSHQQKVQALGIGAEPLALPPAREEMERIV